LKASVVRVERARRRSWSGWSSGRRSGGCSSWPGGRSRRSRGAPAAIADTVRRALRAKAARYERRPAPSKLDPFKEEIHRLLGEDAKLPGQRMGELIEPLGYTGSKTILDDYLREVRPLFAPPPRTFQRTTYRPGEVC
jgi:hypothetical protein